MKIISNKKLGISIIISLVAIVYYLNAIKGDDEVANVWEPFSEWYEWKKTTELTQEQRAVVDYFDKATEIREKAQSNNVKNLSPDEAIKIIEDSMNTLKNTGVPKSCLAYHDALLRELGVGLEYQRARKKGASSDELHKITLRILAVDGKKFTAFFDTIEEIGLFDNLEKDMEDIEKSSQ